MHSGKRFPHRHDPCFGLIEFREPSFDGRLGSKVFSKAGVSRMVSCFALKQAAIKHCQLLIGDMLREGLKTLATAGLDQPGNEQSIHGAPRFAFSHEGVESAAILARLKSAKTNPSSCQQIDDHVKMFQLFIDNRGHLTAKLDVFHVMKNQIERGPRCLFLAVGVVDEHFFQIGIDLG